MYSYSTPKALESPLKMPKKDRSFKYYIDRKGVERHTAVISQTKWPRSSLLNRKYQKQRDSCWEGCLGLLWHKPTPRCVIKDSCDSSQPHQSKTWIYKWKNIILWEQNLQFLDYMTWWLIHALISWYILPLDKFQSGVQRNLSLWSRIRLEEEK